MSFLHIWLSSYLHPHHSLDALAKWTTPRYGAGYTLIRGVMLALLFYMPFYWLKFEPLSPAYLQFLDTPEYFLYAALIWPVFGLLSWVYLSGVIYLLLRLLGYRANFDQLLNVGGLLGLTIGVVLLIFDWLMVALGFHNSALFLGVAHVLIADPWSITLTAYFYRNYFGVPVWLSVLLGILVRLLFIPVAMLFIRT